MKLEFYKYHGAGNDFIMVDNRSGDFPVGQEIIESICHRRLGAGGDGLILLNQSNKQVFSMRYFNSDGNEGSMCGNGGRCITSFANSLGLISNEVNFEAIDGVHEAEIIEKDDTNAVVKLSMNDVSQIERIDDCLFLDTGSPHYVMFVKDLNAFDVVGEGRKIRNSSRFARKGTNVDFAEAGGNGIFVRTYERGVEDETLSCGTGVVASALAYALTNPGKSEVAVQTLGGELKVSFTAQENKFTGIWLTGPATFVYKGIIQI